MGCQYYKKYTKEEIKAAFQHFDQGKKKKKKMNTLYSISSIALVFLSINDNEYDINHFLIDIRI